MKLGICGLGLIGSSVARAVVPDHDVVGLDPDPQAAAGAGQVGVTIVDSLASMVDCDLILLAAPTTVNTGLLAHLIAVGPRVPTADLGSVKGPIVGIWSEDRSYPFVATHPMAGSERAGVAAGQAGLFHGSAWPVVVEADTDPAALQQVITLILGLGAHVIPVSAPVHDHVVATVSHLPHLLAGVLGDVVATSAHRDLAVGMAAGSFRDGTRVCGSPPQRTAEFVVTNPDAAAAARVAAARLEEAAVAIDAGDKDALARWLTPAAHVRAQFDIRHDAATHDVAAVGPIAVRDVLHQQRDRGLAVLARTAAGIRVRGGVW